eukprot:gene15418-16991_t
MADHRESVKLKEENAQLLQQLKSGISHLKGLVSDTERRFYLQKDKNKENTNVRAKSRASKSRAVIGQALTTNSRETTLQSYKENTEPFVANLRADDCMQTRKGSFERIKMTDTSTPLQMRDMENKSSFVNRNKTVKRAARTPTKSILVTPARKNKTPKQQNKMKVTFPADELMCDVSRNATQISLRDKSFLGYDWIAGTLDNDDTSVCEQSDVFFEELKEFRRVNRDDNAEALPLKSRQEVSFREDKESIQRDDICCGSTYTIDGRLFPIPIHGPFSQCPVCRTKEDKETDSNESYIRVSVPRATLQSPYCIRPHRRRSFDPSDSVALSEHCLAGWQSARPAYAPGPENIDLQSNIQIENGISSFGRSQNRRTTYQRETDELLNMTIAMRRGLQLLEHRFEPNQRANTTSYPSF